MPSNNTGDAKVERRSNRSLFKVLSGHENIDLNILFSILRMVNRQAKGYRRDGVCGQRR